LEAQTEDCLRDIPSGRGFTRVPVAFFANSCTWTSHGPRLSLDDFEWADLNAFASEVAERNGKFYWYVSVRKASTGTMSIGVAEGDTPLGPFRDALGGPLIDDETANSSAFDIDPTVFVDDDGEVYIYWGSFSSPRAAKLKPNMIELEDLGLGGQATGPRVPGQIGNAVRLNGLADYVDLPDGIVSSLNDFTIATWVNRTTTSGQTWSRVFDFGTGTQVNMFLTPNAGGPAGARFAITTNGGGAEQQVTADDELPTGWHHVAVTKSGTTVTLWVDGVAVATNTNVTLNPSALGNTTNNWIGRSQYPDPFLDATVDDFQIYDRALGAEEVHGLAGGAPGAGNVASYPFDEESGPTAFDSSGNELDATIVSPPINVIEPEGLPGFWEAALLFKRRNLYYLAYARGHPLTGGNPATIDYATATKPLGPWTYRGQILGTVHNTTTNHPAIVKHRGDWYITYHNGMLEGGGEFRRSVSIERLHFNPDGTIRPVEQTLSEEASGPISLYPFDEAEGSVVIDTTGHGWDGTAVNDPERVQGQSGNAVSLNGVDQYVGLPQGIVWNMYDFTVASWVKLNDRLAGQRIFDFGSSSSSMYLTPEADSGTVRFGIRTNPFNERQIDGSAPLPVGQWVHVAVVKSALTGRVYVNGTEVGQLTNLPLYPAQLGNTPNNWIGRSQNEADPFFDGLIDEFRIYQYGLSPDQISTLAAGAGG
jgi:Concanavalin A-like lectin/glucanases superfamily/Glycosyl hydrolases family 43